MAELTVNYSEFVKALKNPDVIVVNVLAKVYYDLVRIPGTENLPVDEIAEGASKVLPDKNQEIIVYCAGFE